MWGLQSKCKAGLILLAILFLTPRVSQAKVLISEIMYDTPGSDSGREWIEVVNESDAMLDMSQFKLFEANTNHKIKSVSGGSFLQPHATGIITQDASKFLADNVHFSGVIFSSSFSLSNTGESLTIRDGNLTDLDTVTYTAGGADGNGLSLHRNGSSFIGGDSHPGVYPEPPGTPKAVVVEKKAIPSKAATLTKTSIVKSSAETPTETTATLAAVAPSVIPIEKEESNRSLILYSLGAITLAMLGTGTAVLVRTSKKEDSESVKEKAAQFEILE